MARSLYDHLRSQSLRALGYQDGGEVDLTDPNNWRVVNDPRDAPRPDPSSIRVVKPVPPSKPPAQPPPAQPPRQTQPDSYYPLQNYLNQSVLRPAANVMQQIGQGVEQGVNRVTQAAKGLGQWMAPGPMQPVAGAMNQYTTQPIAQNYVAPAAEELNQGWQNLWAPPSQQPANTSWGDWKSGAASNVVRGGFELAGPLLEIPALDVAPVATLGADIASYKTVPAIQQNLQKLGVPPGKAALASDVLSAAGAEPVIHHAIHVAPHLSYTDVAGHAVPGLEPTIHTGGAHPGITGILGNPYGFSSKDFFGLAKGGEVDEGNGLYGHLRRQSLRALGYADGGAADDDRPDPSQLRVINPYNVPQDPDAIHVIDRSGKPVPLPKPTAAQVRALRQPPPKPAPAPQAPVQIPQPTEPQPVWQDPFHRLGQKAAQVASGWQVPAGLQPAANVVNTAVDKYGNFLNRSAEQMEQGWQDLWKPSDVPANTPGYWDKYAGAASNLVRGVGGLASPLLVPALVANPVGTLGGIAAGIAGGAGTQAAAQAAGVPQGEASLLGDVGGAWGGGMGSQVTAQGLGQAWNAYRTGMNRALAYPTTGTENLWMQNPERGALWIPGMKLDEIGPDSAAAVIRTGKRGVLTGDDIGRFLEQQVRSQMEAIPHDAPDEAKLARFLEQSRPEIADQLSKGAEKSGINWYEDDQALTNHNLNRVFPELGTNPVKEAIQKSISAAGSNGTAPHQESETGARIYDGYQQSYDPRLGYGQIPLFQPDGTKRWMGRGITTQLVKMNGMIQQLGEDGYYNYLTKPQTIAEIKRFRPGISRAEIIDAGGNPDDPNTTIPGVFALGNKLGRYFNDIRGVPQPGTTVDTWIVRGGQRQMGRMFDHNGRAIESPYPESDRALMMETHRILGQENNLLPRQAQSAQWHYEQDLWRRLGMRAPSELRSAGIEKFLRSKGMGMEPAP